MDTIKLSQLEIENVKRVKACSLSPTENGLTVIGGRNNQGKTSVLDAIAWALGGDRYRPSQAVREGSVLPPDICLKLSNGLVVERRGKNSDLKVTDPMGHKGGQQLLNEFVEQLAIDLPRFMQAPGREKAETLLKIIGVGDTLHELDRQESEVYNRRRAIGQIADQKKKFAKEMTCYPDAPLEMVSASALIRQQQDILTRNGENQRKRDNLQNLEQQQAELLGKLEALRSRLTVVDADLETARKSALDLHDESTEALERNISDVEEINRKVRANLDREKAEQDAQEQEHQYNALSAELDKIRQQKVELLQGASLPLAGLTVADGELLYKGSKWDCMSGANQLKVSTAIVRAINPKCGFVLLDKLEQMDLDTLREFGAWLEAEGLQAIATRVSTGGECSILIEDGYAVPATQETPTQKTTWKAGAF